MSRSCLTVLAAVDSWGGETPQVVIRWNRKRCGHHLPCLVPQPTLFDGVMTYTPFLGNITQLVNLGL